MKDKDLHFGNSIVFSANALSRVIAKSADAAFAVWDMGYSHAMILIYLTKKPSIPIGELVSVLMLTPSTLSRLTEKLEAAGYVKRNSKGRSTIVSLTAKAQKLAPQIEEKWKQLHDYFGAILGTEQLEKLNNRLQKSLKKLESQD